MPGQAPGRPAPQVAVQPDPQAGAVSPPASARAAPGQVKERERRALAPELREQQGLGLARGPQMRPGPLRVSLASLSTFQVVEKSAQVGVVFRRRAAASFQLFDTILDDVDEASREFLRGVRLHG